MVDASHLIASYSSMAEQTEIVNKMLGNLTRCVGGKNRSNRIMPLVG